MTSTLQIRIDSELRQDADRVFADELGAIGMYKYKFKGKSIIDGLLYIPVVIPEIVLGISLLTIFAKVNIPRGMFTLILSHVTFCVPFVIFNVRARLSGYDNSIEEASMDLGANRLVTFFNITLVILVSLVIIGVTALHVVITQAQG